MITQQKVQHILQLLQSEDEVNRTLGKTLMDSQKAIEKVAQAMVDQTDEDFYAHHSQTHILHYFRGVLSSENKKHILNKIEEQMGSTTVLKQFPELEKYHSNLRCKRILASVLIDTLSATHPRTSIQFTNREKHINQIVNCLMVIQPTQLVMYIKKEAYLEEVKALMTELVYLNGIVEDWQELKEVFRKLIKGGNVGGLSDDRQSPLLSYVDLLRKTQFPLLLQVLPSNQPDKSTYVLKVTLNFKVLLKEKTN